jgi:hypothetical protein
MRSASAFVGIMLLTVCLSGRHPAGDAHASSEKVAPVVVDLAKLGWTSPPAESNRAFFKDFALAKLFALDSKTRVFFLNEDLIVIYHTKQEGNDPRATSRFMEAFFIRTRDGSLVSKKKWSVSARKSLDDLLDSEARLIPLRNGRFLAVANGVMSLYNPDLEILKQKKLEPTDFWAAQSVVEGNEIFLRRESTSGHVTYSWLDSDTLEVKYEVPGYQSQDFSARQRVYAGENFVVAASRSGMRTIDRDGQVRTICEDVLCRENGFLRVLSPHYMGWSGRSGIGIIDIERGGLVWSKTTQLQHGREEFQFGEMRSAMSGTKFDVWVTANKNALFAGVQVKPVPTILVYDFANLKERPTVFGVNLVGVTWDTALSPSGRKLALIDGTKVQIFSLSQTVSGT